MDAQNRRDNERLLFAAEVLIAREDRAWRSAVLDLSGGGCALLRPDHFNLHLGAVVSIHFIAGSGPGPVVGARLARIGPRDLGFEYHEPQAIPPRLAATGTPPA